MIKIQKSEGFEHIDRSKFIQLIKSGFNKSLSEDYFDYTKPVYVCLAVEDEHYLGAIVVENVPGTRNVHYLDKIVVAKEQQGNGLGKLLWYNLNGYSDKAIWRAKKENPIIDFYKKKSDGVLNFPDISDFSFFFYGLNSDELDLALKYALKKKPTLA